MPRPVTCLHSRRACTRLKTACVRQWHAKLPLALPLTSPANHWQSISQLFYFKFPMGFLGPLFPRIVCYHLLVISVIVGVVVIGTTCPPHSPCTCRLVCLRHAARSLTAGSESGYSTTMSNSSACEGKETDEGTYGDTACPCLSEQSTRLCTAKNNCGPRACG